MLCNQVTSASKKLATKLAQVRCSLLMAYSVNFIIPIFVFLVIKYFGGAVSRPVACCARGQLLLSAPPLVTPLF